MELEINGKIHRLDVDPQKSLLSVLREDLDLTGSKYGCGEGQCGACTVMIDGEAVRSCVTRVGAVVGKRVVTIEGVEKDGRLHPVQEAFLHEEALQCGYCTPGMIMSALALLRKSSHPTRAQIADFMNGNVCRCGTYARIVRAVQRAAAQLAEVSSD